MREKILTLLLLFGLSATAVASEPCTTSPSVPCLLDIATGDIAALPDDEQGEQWRERYSQLLGQQLYRDFTISGLDAVLPRLLQMPPSASRVSTIQDIALELAAAGDEKALELVWEIDSDRTRLEVMLKAVEKALGNERKKLAAALFDDARYLFSRISTEGRANELYREVLRSAKLFNDEELLAAVKYDYRRVVVANSRSVKELRIAGAYRESLQLLQQETNDVSRYGELTFITKGWIEEWGEQSLLNEVSVNGDPLFRAIAMKQLGAAKAEGKEDVEAALGHFDRAVMYGAEIVSAEERDALYDAVGKQYQKLAKRHHLNMDEKILALSRKMDSWESAAGLQISILMSHMEAQDLAGTRAITEREDAPLMWGLYHFMMLETARGSGDAAATLMHVREATRYLLQMEDREIRVEAILGLAQELRKAGEIAEGKKLVRRAETEAASLSPETKVRMLKKCAREMEKMGAEIEAQNMLRQAFDALRQVEEYKKRLALMADLADEKTAETLAPYLTQRYYEMETTLQGKELVGYYLMRARGSERAKRYQSALSYLTQALQYCVDDAAVNEVVHTGLSMFDEKKRLSLALKLLQHPAISDPLRKKRLSLLFKRMVKAKNLEAARTVAAAMDDEAQLEALGTVLEQSLTKGARERARNVFADMKRLTRNRSYLKTKLLDALLGKDETPLPQPYRREAEKLVAALGREDERLFYRLRLLEDKPLRQEKARREIAGVLPQVLALPEQGGRARVLVLAAEILNGSE